VTARPVHGTAGTAASSDGADILACEKWPTFEDMLNRFSSPDPWRKPTAFDYDGFYRAAVEASELKDGLTLLVVPQPLSADSSLAVQYVGEGSSEDGCIFYAFLFRGCGFYALIWIEDDLRRARLAWRGDEDAYVRAELLLRLFEGETLAHLR